MASVTFNSFQLDDTELLSFDPSRFTLSTSVSFTKNVRSSAGPAVFAVEMKASGDDLDLTAATFDDCGSVSETSGYIGAIRVTLTSGGGGLLLEHS